MSTAFFEGRRVFITGITGFKGTWLATALRHRGADVRGLDIVPHRFFEAALPDQAWENCDVRDAARTQECLRAHDPEILFHLAAQPIVSIGYQEPVETFDTNVVGTAHILSAARDLAQLRSLVVVTSDKCYRNDGDGQAAFREADALGGNDPYSASKAAQELVAQSYARSFFAESACNVATGRAGNTIGGGDFAADRIIPDIVRAAESQSSVTLRNPGSVRPWQHVLDPVAGYMRLAECLWEGAAGSAYNFGPDPEDPVTVGRLTERLVQRLGSGTQVEQAPGSFAETHMLRLDSSRAHEELDWRPRFDTREAIDWTADWYAGYLRGEDPANLTQQQIEAYFTRR